MKHQKNTMNSSGRSQWLDKVYSARNNTELAEGYDAWAQDYEQDVLSFGYKIPAIMSGLIGRYLPSGTGRILDAGAGTGILGENLFVMGYKDLVGIDLSAGMLEVARKKGVYRNLLQMTLGQKLDFADNAFAATVSMGVFTKGHAPAESFDELIRITEPRGYIIFSVRADVYLNQGFKKKQDSLKKEGKWRLVEQTEPFQALPLGNSKIYNRVFVYRAS
jgi:predicted TPR repeat methyltransferase